MFGRGCNDRPMGYRKGEGRGQLKQHSQNQNPRNSTQIHAEALPSTCLLNSMNSCRCNVMMLTVMGNCSV
jgi:hypothetical protein